jgi:bile acid:Na+ symporter, BASS family
VLDIVSPNCGYASRDRPAIMTDHLQRLADFSILAFVVSSMLAIGMSERLVDVIAPLKKPLSIVLALVVNFVLSPLFAVALSRLVPLQPGHAVGLLLLGTAAGAPFLPKLAEISGGSLAYSVALMVLLMGGSIVFMPLTLPLIVPGVSAGPWAIATPLLLFMLTPLALGFTLALACASWVKGLVIFARRISNLSLVLVVVLMIGLNLKTLLGTVGSYAIGTYGLYMLAIIGAGYLLGATDKSTRTVFALGAGSRNIVAALVVARASFDDPAVTVMLLVAFIVSLVVLLALAKAMRLMATT